jgi:hypothetical protein
VVAEVQFYQFNPLNGSQVVAEVQFYPFNLLNGSPVVVAEVPLYPLSIRSIC